MISGSNAHEIFNSVRGLVQSNQLNPGDLLPPVRELAETLAINRNTVASAYRRLCDAGLAVAEGRRGTSISFPPAAGEQEGGTAGGALTDLAHGNPAAGFLIPAHLMSLEGLTTPHIYGDATILPELADIGREWLAPDCPKSFELELTNGAVDAIERIVAGWLIAGDSVAVENPCYLGTLNALRLAGMSALGVRVDSEGMIPSALDEVLARGAQAVLITPRAHNPTGCGLTLGRARALRKVLAKYPNTVVLIDDHFALVAETTYQSVLPPELSRWALIRSVSKGMGPDMRLAFVACDTETASRLRARLAPGMNWVSKILQTIVLNCFRSPNVRARVQEASTLYAARRAHLVHAMKAAGIESEVWASDGLNVWLSLPGADVDIAAALAERGWRVRLGSTYSVDEDVNGIRITISSMTAEIANRFVRDLKSCLDTAPTARHGG
jgi:DNA-binding transcriptional MocR family regulator